MSQAKTGDTVKIHYTGTLDDGTQFDSSAGKEPLEFELGSGNVIPGFEKAVEGMAVGDSKSIRFEAEDAYGQRSDHLVQEVPRSNLPESLTPEVGMALQSRSPDGDAALFTVIAVSSETFTVDGNHPLAGHALSFEIELVSIL